MAPVLGARRIRPQHRGIVFDNFVPDGIPDSADYVQRVKAKAKFFIEPQCI
jgi:hypothetical protein